MTLPSNLALVPDGVPRKIGGLALVMDQLRLEASRELGAAFRGISGKRIDLVGLPGCGRHGISRALNGCSSNPLYRIVALFVLMKRLGMGRERALRIIGWLRELVDQIWPDDQEIDPRRVLEEEQRLDSRDDAPQQRLAWGEPGAAAEMLEAVRAQQAHAPLVIQVLRRLAGEQG